MQTSESMKAIAPALVAAQKALGPVGMSGDNKFDKYRYAKLEDYVRAIGATLAENGLCILTSVEIVTILDPRTTKAGNADNAVQVTVRMRLLHTSGEWVEALCSGEGQDRADKATYKAITGARKYGIASLLGLYTSDDPEADENIARASGKNNTPATAGVAKLNNAINPDGAAKAAIQQRVERYKSLLPDKTKADFNAWWKATTGTKAITADSDSLAKIDITLLEIETHQMEAAE